MSSIFVSSFTISFRNPSRKFNGNFLCLVFAFVCLSVLNTFGSGAGFSVVLGANSDVGSDSGSVVGFSSRIFIRYFVFKVMKNFFSYTNKWSYIF